MERWGAEEEEEEEEETETQRAPGRQGARTRPGTRGGCGRVRAAAAAAQRAQSCLPGAAGRPPGRPMLCSMANSGCLLLPNSGGGLLPHSVPCAPAFLYLQQVSKGPPAAPPAHVRRVPPPVGHTPARVPGGG